MYFKSNEFNQIPSSLISFNEIGKNYCQLQFFIDYNEFTVYTPLDRERKGQIHATLLIHLYDFVAPLASIFYTQI